MALLPPVPTSRLVRPLIWSAAVALLMSAFPLAVQLAPAADAAVASIDQNRWYTITVRHSGLRVDVRGGATANGTHLQQYAGNTTASQQFRFVSTGGGYFRVLSRLSSSKAWDVSGGRTANGTKVQIWTWTGVKQQQWSPVRAGSGYLTFRPRHAAGKCLDVPNASKASAKQLQIYACNSTTAQQFKLKAGGLVHPVAGACTGFPGAEQIARFLIAGRYLPVCGPRPSWDAPHRYDNVRPYASAAGYYPGYQCAELPARWLYYQYGAAETSGNGAQKVDVYASRYPKKFVKYPNGTAHHAPVAGDVISFSNTSDFRDIGHTGVVASASVNGSGNGTLRLAAQNDGFAKGANGYHDLVVKGWKLQNSGFSYVKWLHAR